MNQGPSGPQNVLSLIPRVPLETLTLSAPTPQDGQTHSNDSLLQLISNLVLSALCMALFLNTQF